MDAINCLMTRRSVRTFLDKKISEKDIETILKAGIEGPTALNKQDIHISAITNKDWLNKMENVIKDALHSDGYKLGYHAPLFIVISGDKNNWLTIRNGGAITENVLLCAHALGLGSVWINQLNTPEVQDREDYKELLKEARIPANYEVVASVAIGYNASNEPVSKPRKPGLTTILK